MAEPRHLLIAGVTTRALAGSAARAGWRVTAIDAFGDLDLRAVAEVVALTRDGGGFTPAAAVEAARPIRAGFVAYTSNLENAPDAVAQLARGRVLLGNPPEVLRRVRQPIALLRTLARRGFAIPRTRGSAGPKSGDWLLKPRRSGGGHGVAPWGGGPVGRSRYLQERIRGRSGSIVFVADGRRATSFGLTRQLAGEPAFGARGFAYCGSLVGGPGHGLFDREDELRGRAEALADAVTEAFGLVGLNGLDFIARDGVPFPTEVNPRVCASMELFERAGGPPLFPAHLEGCRGTLPPRPVAIRAGWVLGKAVVFARRNAVAPDLGRQAHWVADVPHPGDRIGRGHPVCTVFAEARGVEACHRRLAARAARIHALLQTRARGAA